jgi:hypothetical protein
LTEQAVEPVGILHHEEMPDSRRERGLHAVAAECFGVGGPSIGVDRHDRRAQLPQAPEDAALVADGMPEGVDRELGRGGRHVGGHPFHQPGIGIGREQPPNQGPGGAGEVLPERGQERLELVVGRWLPKAAVGIDPDQSRHPLAQAQGRLDDDIAAHGVPDQHQLAQAQLLGHGHDVVAEGGHGPGPAADA